MKYSSIREEELKNKIAQDYFWLYDCTKIIGNVDFCVCMHNSEEDLSEKESLLWAEAKKGKSDIYESFVQLILTIGKARTFDRYLPPAFLGAFDATQIAFIAYNSIHDIFYQNDFNWNVTPSNHETKEFKLVYDKVKNVLEKNELRFNFDTDDKELQKFIKQNFVESKRGVSKIRIDKNNFVPIYNKWLAAVKPTIAVNWDIAKKNGIIDGDFYLADLLSENNKTVREKLYVLLKSDYYEANRRIDEMGMFNSSRVEFTDKQKAHTQFWNKYERPPKEEYWEYIVERRDLLVPQDVRERKGSFFTPQIWVELSQKYIADVLGENWQEEYYVWDCAAGTGNLLAGLTNKYNLWTSTLDTQDVDVMKDRIQNGANLLEDHVFRFDFLNDDFTKLPQGLQDIINDEKKRKKLVVYINPPYAEATSYGTQSIPQVATETKIFKRYKDEIGAEALNELFSQFFTKIYKEIPDSILASFSTPKYITSEKFIKFRNIFKAEFKKGFICPSYTFDNVKGKFPISFLIWNLSNKKEIKQIKTSIFESEKNDKRASRLGIKNFSIVKNKSIGEWRTTFYSFNESPIGYMIIVGPSMQSNNNTYITNEFVESYRKKGMIANITTSNLIQMSIYLAIRQCIETNWLNNKDLYLYPNDGWENDIEFQNDCLAYTLFNNNISSKYGVNHWIPFTEKEVNARDKFESHFMMSFIGGKIIQNGYANLFEQEAGKSCIKREFSPEATDVFNEGLRLWKYYHAAINNLPPSGELKKTVNASLYDIREHFQGRNDKGKMNNKSEDEKYNELIGNLRSALKILAEKIEPKVYEYEFLME